MSPSLTPPLINDFLPLSDADTRVLHPAAILHQVVFLHTTVHTQTRKPTRMLKTESKKHVKSSRSFRQCQWFGNVTLFSRSSPKMGCQGAEDAKVATTCLGKCGTMKTVAPPTAISINDDSHH